MCTSIVVNKKKTIVGWNLDLLDMEYRVRPADRGVYIEVNDATEGWMPLFGANSRVLRLCLPCQMQRVMCSTSYRARDHNTMRSRNIRF